MVLITNIQRYSIHDGPGTRTTAFFKGCPLRCRWCHNPETQSFDQETFYYKERCRGCRACEGLETLEEKEDACDYNARELCGKLYNKEELINELIKDKPFFDTSGGGVTLSGGEVLANDIDFVISLLGGLKAYGIHIAIDTCGAVPFSRFEAALPFTDLFLYDLKIMDDARHIEYTGASNKLIKENLIKLSGLGGRIRIRVPYIKGINDSPEEKKAMMDFLVNNNISYEGIDYLPYHNTGESKYERLGRTYLGNDFEAPDL